MTEISEHHWLFSKNPKHDFMRQNTGKLAPANINLILFILLYLNNGFCKTTKTFGLSMR